MSSPPASNSRPISFLSIIVISAAIGLLALVFRSPLSNLFPPLSKPHTSFVVVEDTSHKFSYRGTSRNGVENFQNIFYAEDTSGRNRFAPPVPYSPPSGSVIDATAPGAWCPQATGDPPLPFASPILNISENCLSLRIVRPIDTNRDARLPVLVYIHGGGNGLGSGYDQMYDSDGLVRLSKENGQPVIFIAMNYRLGIFGYATSKRLRAAKHTNVGLRDQRAAFDWIRKYIAAFGGDPGNVVAIGQSVGAMSIGLHLTSYHGAKGVPFHKAIMLSGATGTTFNAGNDMVRKNTVDAAAAAGCTGDPEGQSTLECLRSLPFEKLNNAAIGLARKARPPFGEQFFTASVDGDYIPERPSLLLGRGDFVKGIPVIASWTANDGAWYANPTMKIDDEVRASLRQFIRELSSQSIEKLLALYQPHEFEHLINPSLPATTQYYRAAQIHRDLWFTCPALDFTHHYNNQRGVGSSSKAIYLFEMNQTKFTPVLKQIGVPFWKVVHLSEVSFILNSDVNPGGDNSEKQKSLSKQLSSSVIAFAWTGNPNVLETAGSKIKEGFSDWPTAFEAKATQEVNDGIEEASIFVVGGKNGSGGATIRRGEARTGVDDDEKGASSRDKAIAWEKLIERCEFINSITAEIGV